MFGIFKRTFNNIFITICRNNGEVLIAKSSGSFHSSKLRTKQRRNLISVTSLSKNIAKLLFLKKIKKLDLFFLDYLFKRHSPKRLAKIILKEFQFRRIKIKYFLSYRVKAHNGVKLPKKKRK